MNPWEGIPPEEGQVIRHKKTKAEWTIFRVDRHLDSQDVSYIRLKNDRNRNRSITLFEFRESYVRKE